MLSINLHSSKIYMDYSLIDRSGQIISSMFNRCKVFIISDTNVAKLYLDKIKKQFLDLKYHVDVFLINPGENSKSLKTVEEMYNALSMNFMSRSDIVIALGGGVVTDVVGFVSATYNRGLNLISIPTSLLAMVDASVGGKNGINSIYGKNLIGIFYHPKLVLVDPSVLNTLPQNEINCGMAEVIKYGCIRDKSIFDILENELLESNLKEIIHKSILVKKELVEKDVFDLGDRMLLNFGHTFGHAIEKLYNYEVFSHGEAVAMGMNIITRISESMNITEKGTESRLSSICKKYSLPTECDDSIEKIVKIILRDKKIIDNHLNLILLKNIGEGFIYKIPSKEIIDFFKL